MTEAPTFKIDSNRSYTLGEIEQLRSVCENKYCFGSYTTQGIGFSRSYREAEKNEAVETMVHSHMRMGVTADDLIEHERQSAAAMKARYEEMRAKLFEAENHPRDETSV